MFKVTLSQFGNLHDLESEKRRRENPKDEVFLKIGRKDGGPLIEGEPEEPASEELRECDQ